MSVRTESREIGFDRTAGVSRFFNLNGPRRSRTQALASAPGSAHQAVACTQEHYREGCRWVVDLDLEKFSDRVNHDTLMALVEKQVADWRVRRLIRRYLQAGMRAGEIYIPRGEGTPQGGPLSPLLANLLLDQLDKELEHRSLRFARYADDCNIYVHSRRAAYRVKESITRFFGEATDAESQRGKEPSGQATTVLLPRVQYRAQCHGPYQR